MSIKDFICSHLEMLSQLWYLLSSLIKSWHSKQDVLATRPQGPYGSLTARTNGKIPLDTWMEMTSNGEICTYMKSSIVKALFLFLSHASWGVRDVRHVRHEVMLHLYKDKEYRRGSH